jgi:hypothetical protein
MLLPLRQHVEGLVQSLSAPQERLSGPSTPGADTCVRSQDLISSKPHTPGRKGAQLASGRQDRSGSPGHPGGLCQDSVGTVWASGAL